MIRIAQISDNPLGKYSETFVSYINKNLKGDVIYIYGRGIPIRSNIDGYLFGFNKIYILLLKIGVNFKLLKQNYRYYLLKKYLLLKKFNVVVAEYGNVGEMIAPLCKQLNLPLIIHFHGYDIFRNDILEKFNNYKNIINSADAFIAKSKLMEEKIISMGAERAKIHYIPSGAQSVFFKVEPDYSSDFIISVGRFIDKKAPYVVLDVFKKIVEKKSRIKLIFIGEGPLLQSCKNLAKIWNIENNVIFTGAVSHQIVLKNLAQAFCFIQHSITTEEGDKEGTPNSLMEASAAGLPVIATKHSGNIEAVIHNETGFLTEELDINSVIEHILNLEKNREKAKQMGLAGRKHIKNNFSAELYLKRMNSLIQGILSQESRF